MPRPKTELGRPQGAVFDGMQNCCVHTPPGGVQIPQLELQHTSPTGHRVLPHTGPPGPPASAFDAWHTPPQSRPPCCGSQMAGFMAQRSPGLHMRPAMPPQLCPTSRAFPLGAGCDDGSGSDDGGGEVSGACVAAEAGGGAGISGGCGAGAGAHAVDSNASMT